MDDQDPNDFTPRPLTREEREQRRQVSSLGGGCGFLGIPLLIPILLAIAIFLYPIPGTLAVGVWYIAEEIASGMGLEDIPLWIATYLPSGAVLWATVRWDTWLGENTVYWLVRHIARNLLLIVLLMVMTAVEGGLPDAATIPQVVGYYFHNTGALAISAGVLAFFNFVLIGKHGFMRRFWHTLLDAVQMRPAGIDE